MLYLTHAQLRAESQSASAPQLQITLQSPNQNDLGQGYRRDPNLALQHLELTSEQLAQIQTLQNNARPDLAALTAQLTVEQDALERLIASEDTSAADLRMQHQVLQELQREIAANRFEVLLAMREVLTPEQRMLLSIQAELPLEASGHQGAAKIRLN
mgnify:FL=1